MTKWWEDPMYDYAPMDYPTRVYRQRRLTLTTDPEMVRTRNGALTLRLRNRHPHERLRIFVAPGRP